MWLIMPPSVVKSHFQAVAFTTPGMIHAMKMALRQNP